VGTSHFVRNGVNLSDFWEDKRATSAQDKSGTSIRVTHLTDGAGDRFGEASFQRALAERISITYALFIQAGITIVVNGATVKSTLPSVASGTYQPVSKRIRKEGVDSLIIAGVTPGADKVPRGWYVFCNGRMVLEADKTRDTGWGTLLPVFHSKYNHFVGFVYLRVTVLPTPSCQP